METRFSENEVASKIKILADNRFFKKKIVLLLLHVKMEDISHVGSALRSIQLPDGIKTDLNKKILFYIFIYHWNKSFLILSTNLLLYSLYA